MDYNILDLIGLVALVAAVIYVMVNIFRAAVLDRINMRKRGQVDAEVGRPAQSDWVLPHLRKSYLQGYNGR